MKKSSEDFDDDKYAQRHSETENKISIKFLFFSIFTGFLCGLGFLYWTHSNEIFDKGFLWNGAAGSSLSVLVTLATMKILRVRR